MQEESLEKIAETLRVCELLASFMITFGNLAILQNAHKVRDVSFNILSSQFWFAYYLGTYLKLLN